MLKINQGVDCNYCKKTTPWRRPASQSIPFFWMILLWNAIQITAEQGTDPLPDCIPQRVSVWSTKYTRCGIRAAVDTYTDNATISKYGLVENWDVSNVTNFRAVFDSATSFDADISKWNISKAVTTQNMFYKASSFNSDISKWDTSKVTVMYQMFAFASSFNRNLSKWIVAKVTTFVSMFEKASLFNSDISNWDTSKATTFRSMFYECTTFNSDVSKWNTWNAESMEQMFQKANAFDSDVSKWVVSKVKSMYRMFFFARKFNGDVSKWDVRNVQGSGMVEMFTMQRDAWGVMTYTAFNQLWCGELWEGKIAPGDFDNSNGMMKCCAAGHYGQKLLKSPFIDCRSCEIGKYTNTLNNAESCKNCGCAWFALFLLNFDIKFRSLSHLCCSWYFCSFFRPNGMVSRHERNHNVLSMLTWRVPRPVGPDIV